MRLICDQTHFQFRFLFSDQSAKQIADCSADTLRTGFKSAADSIQQLDCRIRIFSLQYFQCNLFLVP